MIADLRFPAAYRGSKRSGKSAESGLSGELYARGRQRESKALDVASCSKLWDWRLTVGRLTRTARTRQ